MTKDKLDFTAAKELAEQYLRIDTVTNARKNLAACFLKLIEENEDYKTALEFYADMRNWTPADNHTFSAIRHRDFPNGDSDCDTNRDTLKYHGGKRAREVLERHKEKL